MLLSASTIGHSILYVCLCVMPFRLLLRWMKKSGVHSVNIYCDENMDLMRAYTALGEKVRCALSTLELVTAYCKL